MRLNKICAFIICLFAGFICINPNSVFADENISVKYGQKFSLDQVFGEDVFLGEEKSAFVSVSGDTFTAIGVGKTTFAVRTSDGLELLNVTVIPKKVTGLKVRRNKTEALLQWTKQENASYAIYRSNKKNGKYKRVGTLKNSYWADTDYNKVQWVDTELKSGKKYYYKVRAYCKIDGERVYGLYSGIKKLSKYSKSSTELCYGAMPYINEIRKKEGLRPLLWDYNAESGAKTRAKEINREFSHTRPDGRDCMTAYRGVVGYSENIALGAWSYKIAIEDWMNSSGHRGLILMNSTEDAQLGEFACINSFGIEYPPYSTIPGDVCGMSVAKKGVGFVFVVTRIKNLSGAW